MAFLVSSTRVDLAIQLEVELNSINSTDLTDLPHKYLQIKQNHMKWAGKKKYCGTCLNKNGGSIIFLTGQAEAGGSRGPHRY